MPTTVPRLIVNPEASQALRARYAPRFGERPNAVTLGPHIGGLPQGRYYVHPDGSLTRPRDELHATLANLREGFNRIAEAMQPVAASLQAALTAPQSDYIKGA